MAKEFDKDIARTALENGYNRAETILNDEDKMERFLQRLEKKLKLIPVLGEKLADVPIMVSLVRSYVKKEYTDIPIGSIIAIISALLYFVSPVDLIPETIPGVGYLDDAAVIAACWEFVDSDVKEYINWREKNGKTVEDI